MHRERFPVNVNTASREMLLRVPGLGVRVVDRIISSRRQAKLRYADLTRLGASLRKAKHFIVAADYHPSADDSSSRLRSMLACECARRRRRAAGAVLDQPMYACEAKDFAQWRAAARPLIATRVRPADVVWSDWRQTEPVRRARTAQRSLRRSARHRSLASC